jgi:hypothetical protein
LPTGESTARTGPMSARRIAHAVAKRGSIYKVNRGGTPPGSASFRLLETKLYALHRA